MTESVIKKSAAGSGPTSIPWYLVARRTVQVTVLVLFWLGAHREINVLVGNLSAATLFDTVPLVDPYALLQILFTGHLVPQRALLGAAILLATYLILGRVFCSWVCPVNMVTDLAGSIRNRLHIPRGPQIPRVARYWILGLSLLLSSITGFAAFEWISPVAMFHRELIFGVGFGLSAVGGIFVLDLLVYKSGWCGSLCPIGAFYSQVGRFSRLRMKFCPERCDRCLDCVRVCPEPQVINFKAITRSGRIVASECTNCLRCVEVCTTDAFSPRVALNWKPLQTANEGENDAKA